MRKSIEPNPLVLPPKLAAFLGKSAATFLQQLHYWLQKSKHVIDGLKWVYNSYPSWAEQILLSATTIKRIVASLKELKLIQVEQHSKSELNQVNWYTIDYARLEALIASIGSKRPTRSERFEQIEMFKMTSSFYLSTETTPETSSQENLDLGESETDQVEPTEPVTADFSTSGTRLNQSVQPEPTAIGEDQNSAAAPLPVENFAIESETWKVHQAPWKASLGRYKDSMLEAVFATFPKGQAFKHNGDKRNDGVIVRFLNKLGAQARQLTHENAIEARSELLLLWDTAQAIEARFQASEQLRSSSTETTFRSPDLDQQQRLNVLNGLLKAGTEAGQQTRVLKLLAEHPEWGLEFNGATVVEVTGYA